MKKLAAFLIINGAFIAANAVAAGGMLLLGKGAAAMDTQSVWPWVTAGIGGVTIGIFFLKLLMEKS